MSSPYKISIAQTLNRMNVLEEVFPSFTRAKEVTDIE